MTSPDSFTSFTPLLLGLPLRRLNESSNGKIIWRCELEVIFVGGFHFWKQCLGKGLTICVHISLYVLSIQFILAKLILFTDTRTKVEYKYKTK